MSFKVYVIVPDGLKSGGSGSPVPSFVYRKVIEYVANIVNENDEIYFAPANTFGLDTEEQIVGHKYFKSISRVHHWRT